MLTPTDFLRLALDPVRLAVLGHAAAGPLDTDRLAGELGLPRRRVLRVAAQLRAAGILDGEYRLARDVLQQVARALPTAEPAAPAIVGGHWTEGEREVLGRFFSGSRLETIPTSRGKRLVVLDRLAQEFEPGVRYAEADINLILQLFHRDYASLRRYLVDEGFLTRAEGVYWRTGGRVGPGDGGDSEAPAPDAGR